MSIKDNHSLPFRVLPLDPAMTSEFKFGLRGIGGPWLCGGLTEAEATEVCGILNEHFHYGMEPGSIAYVQCNCCDKQFEPTRIGTKCNRPGCFGTVNIITSDRAANRKTEHENKPPPAPHPTVKVQYKVGDRVWLQGANGHAIRARVRKVAQFDGDSDVFSINAHESPSVVEPIEVIGVIPPPWWQFWRRK